MAYQSLHCKMLKMPTFFGNVHDLRQYLKCIEHLQMEIINRTYFEKVEIIGETIETDSTQTNCIPSLGTF